LLPLGAAVFLPNDRAADLMIKPSQRLPIGLFFFVRGVLLFSSHRLSDAVVELRRAVTAPSPIDVRQAAYTFLVGTEAGMIAEKVPHPQGRNLRDDFASDVRAALALGGFIDVGADVDIICAAKLGLGNEARMHADLRIKRFPDQPGPKALAAEVEFTAENYRGALRIADEALKTFPTDPGLLAVRKRAAAQLAIPVIVPPPPAPAPAPAAK
jgi:hypothetical protein